MNVTTIEYINEQINTGFIELGLPDYMKDAVIRWVFDGIPTGSFLEGILSNNLSQSVFYADGNNKHKIVEWTQFSHWYLPSICRGDSERVRDWKGLNNA